MARVLVTGAAGFTGRYVAQALDARGHQVIGMAHHANGTSAARESSPVQKTYSGDLTDIASLRELIKDAEPEIVVHLAAISFVAHSDSNAFYTTNLIGTSNLLNALAEAGKPIEQVLLASSANVYGNRQGGQLSEDTPAQPSNHYGVSKYAMEQVARLMDAKLPIIITRPFNYTGVGQSANFIIPKLIDHARRRETRLELGNIDVSRDFSDVRTVADCYVRLLEAPSAIGGTFNICSGRSYKLRDVISMIEELADIRFDISVNPAFVRSDEIMELYGSRARLDSVIGETPATELRETLRWMLEG